MNRVNSRSGSALGHCYDDSTIKIVVAITTAITCHVGSRSVTCHSTKVNMMVLTSARHASLDLPILEAQKAEFAWWLVISASRFTCTNSLAGQDTALTTTDATTQHGSTNFT